jgi:F-type H+-transporting ATPase subunit delta
MFHPGHWAAAFINSLDREGADSGEGVEVLGVLASWIRALPGEVFGSSPACKAERLIREGLAKSGTVSPAGEIAARFIALMIRKNAIRHIDPVIDEAKKLLNRKRGVVAVFAEYAFPAGADVESRISEIIKRKTGAAGVELVGRVRPELIGGCRLRIGDEIIDASIRSQMRRLEAHLAVAYGGRAYGGFNG